MRILNIFLIVFIFLQIRVDSFGQSISLSHQSGSYDQSFYLRITSDVDIRYTLDGNIPEFDSPLLEDSLLVAYEFPPMKYSLIPTNNMDYNPRIWPNREFGWRPPENEVKRIHCIRLLGFEGDIAVTDTITRVFYLDSLEQTLPIIALATDSAGLFSFESGIYVPGRKYDPDEKESTGNYYMKGSKWERPGHICYIDINGTTGFSQDIGIRIHGGYTRQNPQKSLRIYARQEYGSDRIDYPFFGDEGPDNYKRIVIRSAMTNWFERNTIFQDEFLNSLIYGQYPEIDIQLYQPVNLYINGEFWGLSILRERQDEYYLSDHYNHPESEFEIVEPSWEPNTDFDSLIDFCRENSLKDVLNYQWVCDRIDLINFIHYTLFELFVYNQDWPHNNYKIWRSKENDIPWRWMFFDFDASLRNPEERSINKLMETDSPHAILLKSLSENQDFEDLFLSEWEIMRQRLFNPAILGETLNKFFMEYKNAVPDHIERWHHPEDIETWSSNIDEIMYFLLERPSYFEKELEDYFDYQFDSDDDDFDPADIFRIYPNPFESELTIESISMLQTNWTVSLVNMHGKTIYSRELGQNREIIIEPGNISAGLYLLQIRSSEFKYSFLLKKSKN